MLIKSLTVALVGEDDDAGKERVREITLPSPASKVTLTADEYGELQVQAEVVSLIAVDFTDDDGNGAGGEETAAEATPAAGTGEPEAAAETTDPPPADQGPTNAIAETAATGDGTADNDKKEE